MFLSSFVFLPSITKNISGCVFCQEFCLEKTGNSGIIKIMKISGFTFIRNGEKFGYPFIQSIRSILPLCDEFIVNYSESDDRTLELLRSIGDKKLRIIETGWDDSLRKDGAILAKQTDTALSYCTGDWCFYIQGDEVLHEQYLSGIRDGMEKYLDRRKVEGLLFKYLHFYGSYRTYFDKRPFYRKERKSVV